MKNIPRFWKLATWRYIPRFWTKKNPAGFRSIGRLRFHPSWLNSPLTEHNSGSLSITWLFFAQFFSILLDGTETLKFSASFFPSTKTLSMKIQARWVIRCSSIVKISFNIDDLIWISELNWLWWGCGTDRVSTIAVWYTAQEGIDDGKGGGYV